MPSKVAKRKRRHLVMTHPPGVCGGTYAMLCPVCGGDNVAPSRVRITPPGPVMGDLMVDASGIYLDRTAKHFGPGVLIELSFSCQDGHQFAYYMRFHKDATFMGGIEVATTHEDDETRPIWSDPDAR